jgi:hypothetical protein
LSAIARRATAEASREGRALNTPVWNSEWGTQSSPRSNPSSRSLRIGGAGCPNTPAWSLRIGGSLAVPADLSAMARRATAEASREGRALNTPVWNSEWGTQSSRSSEPGSRSLGTAGECCYSRRHVLQDLILNPTLFSFRNHDDPAGLKIAYGLENPRHERLQIL